MSKAIDLFEQAIQLEPNYAQAYAYIAGTYAYLGATGQVKPEKAFDIVNDYSEKALQLDDTIAESHVAKANAHMFYNGIQKRVRIIAKSHSVDPAHRSLRMMGLFMYLQEKYRKP